MAQLASIVEAIVAAEDSLDRVEKSVLPLLKASNTQILGATAGIDVDPLQSLDPSKHSLGYLYILVARLQSIRGQDVQYLLQCTMNFSNAFNYTQAWLAPDQMNTLAETLSQISDRFGRPALPIAPLLKCITKAPNFNVITSTAPHHLTRLHSIALKYCLLAKMYRQALPILRHDITGLDKSNFALRVQDFLLYYYYGGMLYIGLKDFGRALEFLQLCISTPANVTSAIQIEAYRKYILVSLLAHGKVLPNLKYTSQTVSRVAQVHSQPFLEFAKAFESGSFNKLQTELVKHQEFFAKSVNLGLAKQCVNALVQQKILNLTTTYLTLSLNDISKAVGQGSNGNVLTSDQVEKEVNKLVENNQVFATISLSDGGMVAFHDSPERYHNQEAIIILDEELRKAMNIAQSVIKMDRQLGTSRDYLIKVAQSEGRMDSRQAGGLERFGSMSSFDDDAMILGDE
jgi:COP9 signalosome complex subunit 3